MIFSVFRSGDEASEQGDKEWACEGAGQPISAVLQKGCLFRPGLVSLVGLALQATKQVELDKTKTELLLDALKLAEAT